MALFIGDQTARQRAMFLDRQIEEATALSQTLSTSAAGWIAASDISGLQELVEAQRRYPEILFAMLADKEGRVLADTDKSRKDLYMLDLPGETRQTILLSTPALVDVVTPAMIGGHHVGWARIGIGQKKAGEKLAAIIRDGVAYALAAILIGSIIAWFMGRQITKRLYAVQETIAAIRSGNLLARSSLTGNDEAAVMAREFNHMLDVIGEKDAELRDKTEEMDHFFNDAIDLLCIADTDGNFRRLNAAWESLLGLPVSELEGRSFLDFVHPDDLEATLQAVSGLAEQKEVVNFINRYRNNNGEYHWIEWRAFPSGQRIYAVARDITERKQNEQNIALMRFALDNVHEAAYLTDENARFLYVNEESCRILGYTRDELLTLTVADIAPDQPSTSWPDHWRLMQTQRSLTFESSHKTGDGHTFPVEISVNYFEYDNKGHILALARDITERKEAEQERLANLRFFESMDQINRAIQGSCNLESMMSDVLDVVLECFDCDRVFLLHPCDPEAGIWRVPMERNKPEYPGIKTLKLDIPMDQEVAETFRILLNADGPVQFGPGTEHPLPADVSERFGFKSFMAMALHPKTGKPWQFGMHQCSYPRVWTPEEEKLLQEIGRRLADALTNLLTNRDLEESKEFNRIILETVDEGVIVVDRDYRILSANKAFCDMGQSSEEQVFGRLCHKIWRHSDQPCFESGEECAVKHTFETGTAHFITQVNEDASGAKRYMELKSFPITDASGKIVSVIKTVNDVTARRKMEGQLQQAQKMEAIGTLAGGVAHDFNNMLMVILGHTELLLHRVEPTHPFHESLQKIQKAAGRSAYLTRQLLAFARKQTVVPKVLDLNETTEGMLKMLRRLIGEDIDLAWLPGKEIWPIRIDPSQLDQILANLCINARDAIAGVGKVTIETCNAPLDPAYCADHPEVAPGEYILISVSDNGCGMDKQTMAKIFEPFYTTKDVGKGTGLGLATVYGIVKQNNGFVNVYSEPGRGSTFKIYLPRHAVKMEELADTGETAPVARGSETILLVEDEPTILEMVQKMLESFGYRVLAAPTTDEAIRRAGETHETIHLLLTDVIMPEMNGQELAKNLHALHPNILTLFMSGYSANVIARHGVLEKGINFIQKPFSMQTLATKVREALDSGQKHAHSHTHPG